MVALIAASLYILLISFSLGAAAFRVFLKNIEHPRVLDVFFTGVCVANTFFTWWSLSLPTGILASLLLLGISLVYLAVDGRWLARYLSDSRRHVSCSIRLPALILLLLFLLLAGILPPRLYDSGLYHMQAIKWIESYKVIPGLGNVHDRFAFNSNFFTLAAGCTFRGIFGQPVYAFNFVAVYLFFLWIIGRLRTAANTLMTVCWGCILIIFIRFSYFQLSSPTTDILTVMLAFYLCIRIRELFLVAHDQVDAHVYLIIILGIYLITLKLSMIPILLVLPFLWVHFKPGFRMKQLGWLALITAVITVPWLIRFYYLSGYLLFPCPVIDLFDPAWKIPAAEIYKTLEYTSLSAKAPFPVWLANQRDILYTVLIVASFLSPLFIFFLWVKHRRQLLDSKILALWAINYLGLIFWFLTVPVTRFGLSYILVCTFFPLMVGTSGVSFRRTAKLSFQVVALLYFLFITLQGIFGFFSYRSDSSKVALNTHPVQEFLVKPLSFKAIAVDLPHKTFILDSLVVDGREVWFPHDDTRCFDACLPCIGSPSVRFRFLGPKMEDGFGPAAKKSPM